MYVAVKGGERAIDNAHRLLAHERRGARDVPGPAGDGGAGPLYFFESNTRSATIIGIVGAGGVGIYLTELIRVLELQQVAFLILMILVTVAAIDFVSGRLRAAMAGQRETDAGGG